jgi:hypothetical protein
MGSGNGQQCRRDSRGRIQEGKAKEEKYEDVGGL